MPKRLPPPEATCCVCLGRKKCILTRDLFYGIKEYDNFFYSEEHRGWICRQCKNKLKNLTIDADPFESLREPDAKN